ncbi:MAG: phosphopantetheine-binding protein [Bacteroidales bacterium]|nr:phosphopantetheine-binding protein [Bacteroidales bacterium]MCQ2608424.1 phosphopantetheine-binding protein [Bacteroidales bacterium]
MEELILELKKEIIEVLNLEEITPEDIDTDAPLFGEGLGLDSIDALELMMLMQKNYGIKVDNSEKGKEIFKSIRVMAEFISNNRTK